MVARVQGFGHRVGGKSRPDQRVLGGRDRDQREDQQGHAEGAHTGESRSPPTGCSRCLDAVP